MREVTKANGPTSAQLLKRNRLARSSLLAPERFTKTMRSLPSHSHKHVTSHSFQPPLKYHPEDLLSVSASSRLNPIVLPTPDSPTSIPAPASLQLFPAPIITPTAPLSLALDLTRSRSRFLCSLER